MRHQYTPVFREITTSSIWAKSPSVRCVWFYLMLHADPEGFVPGTVPGLAVAANVSIEEAREAVGLFMAPDPDSNTQDFEGRRLEKVPHGWRILNFVYWRELAKHEAEKARKRNWMQQRRNGIPRDASADVHERLHVDESSETVDAPKPKPLSSFSSSLAEPLVLHRWPEGLELNEEFIARAKTDGVQDPQRWFDKLKSGPIGGSRGVFVDKLNDYLEGQIANWRTWEETERAKDAQRRAATASPSRRPFDRTQTSVLEPNGKQRAFAAKHGIDINQILKDLAEENVAGLLGEGRAKEMLGERLTVAVKQKQRGQPVTGRLTPEQLASWGSPPTGGAIPEVA